MPGRSKKISNPINNIQSRQRHQETKLYNHVVKRDWKSAIQRLKKYPSESSVCIFTALPDSIDIPTMNPDFSAFDIDYKKTNLFSVTVSTEIETEKLEVKLRLSYETLRLYPTNRLPIHTACASKPSLAIIQALISAFPQSIRQRSDGMLPLHIACHYGADIKVIEALIRYDPTTVYEKDKYGLSSMDLATMFHTNKDIIPKLLSRQPEYWFPKRVEQLFSCDPDDDEALFDPSSLYFLLVNKKWDSALKCIDALPDLARIWVYDDDPTFCSMKHPVLPIHVACRYKATKNVLDSLINAYPDGVKARGGVHDTNPLHVACHYSGKFDSIRSLLEAYPEGSEEADDFGLLPIHVAVTEGISSEIVEALIKVNPKSARAEDKRGCTPLHYAEHLLHPNKNNIIEALQEA